MTARMKGIMNAWREKKAKSGKKCFQICIRDSVELLIGIFLRENGKKELPVSRVVTYVTAEKASPNKTHNERMEKEKKSNPGKSGSQSA
ncbi:hypothetical protein CEXT_193281 [Caerostris extrusa]|uniref:Uncharacterized protein n=1 Tax=Caerostris extrusa TaxID=172846 RepID=A0AAV4NWK9_CAEEX|nr:hypothetical protein CEXT_193281 [Caerostris extrusa]